MKPPGRLPPDTPHATSHVTRGFARLIVTLAGAMLASACATLPTQPDQAAAVAAEQARQAARPSSLCTAETSLAFGYRKKLLVLHFPVERPSDATDLPELGHAWSRTLQDHLAQTDRFLLRDGSAFQLDPGRNIREQITDFAERFDAQFIVTGRIVNIQHVPGKTRIGSSITIHNALANRRAIETELQIYDAHSGTPIGQPQRHTRQLIGPTQNLSNSRMLGSLADTPLGETMLEILQSQSEHIEDELACLPLQARIIRTQQHEVLIDAGFTSHLAPGDRLRVIQRRSDLDQRSERAYGELVLQHVYPETAIGRIEGERPTDWRFGGRVRAW